MDKNNIHNLLQKISKGCIKISTQDLNVYTNIHINGKQVYDLEQEKIPNDCIVEYNSLIQDRNKYCYVGRIIYIITLKNRQIQNCLYVITNYNTQTTHNTLTKEKYIKIIESLLYNYE